MLIFPAIDILDGKAVRLLRGDYNSATVFDSDPVAVAQRFFNAGSEYLHVVDLEGARTGICSCADVIKEICSKTGMFVQVGGGVRSLDTVTQLIAAGASRVIFGTAAIEDENLLKSALEKYGSKIAVGADIKDGCIAVKGWTQTSQITVGSFFERMQQLGVTNIICTDISRDGAMNGIDCGFYKELNESYDVAITASGGVSSTDDIRSLSAGGLYGAILGKALYTGKVSMKEALRAC